MKVLFFAQARQIAGCDEHVFDVKRAVTEAEFWILLLKAFPEMAPLQKIARLARHETYLHKDEMLNPGDEIAVIPPVSGG